jgi:hypothetical protein
MSPNNSAKGMTLQIGGKSVFFPYAHENPEIHGPEQGYAPTMSFADTVKWLFLNTQAEPSPEIRNLIAQASDPEGSPESRGEALDAAVKLYFNPPEGTPSNRFTGVPQGRSWDVGVPGAAAVREKEPNFLGYYDTVPVYLDKSLPKGTFGGTVNRLIMVEPERGNVGYADQVALNPNLESNAEQVLKHEVGHAKVGRVFNQSLEASRQYNEINRKEDYESYRMNPLEQAANWIGGIWNTYGDNPEVTPQYVYNLLDELNRLNEEIYRIENMFSPPAQPTSQELIQPVREKGGYTR